MTRFVSVCVAILGVVAVAQPAHAEGMLMGGATLKWNKFFILKDGKYVEPPTADDRRFYVNFAHCACSKAQAGPEQTFRYEVGLEPATATGVLEKEAEVWVGTACGDNNLRDKQCRKIETQTIRDIRVLATSPAQIELSVFDIVNPVTQNLPCSAEKEGDALVWLLVDESGDDLPEYTTSQPVPGTAASTEVTKVDTRAPPMPTELFAQGGEEAIRISWTPPPGGSSDIYYYQALCLDADGAPVRATALPQRYQTSDELCGLAQGVQLAEAPTRGDGGEPLAEVPAAFARLDKAFVCGEAAATARSLTIDGLQNGQAYKVALLVMDRYGNATGAYFNRTVVPQPVTDLWEDIHDRNGEIDGGCLLSQTYGDSNPLTQTLRTFRDATLAKTAFGRALTHAYYASLGALDVEGSIVLRALAVVVTAPLVIVALLWHYLTLPGLFAVIALFALRRRLRPRLRTVALALGLVPAVASGDDFTPYWDTAENDDASLLEYPEVDWRVGIRVGPYIPEIDLQAGLNALTGKGPYEAMFGDYYTRNSAGDLVKHEQRVWQALPVLDVDRVLWDRFGQILVGGSIGYMQKSAYAYVSGSTEHDLMRERSTAGKTTFRLIPAAATVSYRFTYLDDMWGIPVVPYARGGLSYYMWWMKAPNGDLSKVCDEMSAEGGCTKQDKAYGGTLGYQGAVGLSIRAERIDSDAAMSMRNSGIMHAGFYAELSYANVNGFGSDSKLSVGDNTWFAGFEFEF